MQTTRRDFLKTAAFGMMAAGCGRAAPSLLQSTRRQTMFIGTYTRGASEGIYHAVFDPADGTIELTGASGGITNPSYLDVSPDGRFLFAASETREGSVYAYRIDPDDGSLVHLNQSSTQGSSPCYVMVDRDGNHVLAANYGSGNVAVLPIRDDGSLGEATDVEQHEGSGADPGRQSSPHAHCIMLDPANRFAMAVDLGIDQVVVYRYDASSGELTAATPATLAPGAGPRHIDFHPDGRRAYVINELDSTLTALAYDPQTGRLEETQTLSTLPAAFAGENYCADVHVSPSGRFVYGSNRGHDSIVVFAIDESTGDLSPVQHQSTLGAWPRNFGIDPSGRYLLVANQNTDNIVVFGIDGATGRLEPTGYEASVPTPVCIRFLNDPT